MRKNRLEGFIGDGSYPQLYDHNCGPTALAYVVAWDYWRKYVNFPPMIELQKFLTDLMAPTHGAGIDQERMLRFLSQQHIDVGFSTGPAPDPYDRVATVFDKVDEGRPSLVLWEGWGPHWSVVVGYDLDRYNDLHGEIELIDPALGERVHYSVEQFRLLWPKGEMVTPLSDTSKLWTDTVSADEMDR